MGAIWAMSLNTSPGMWPVHLERASRFTGLMTWSVDRSILGREGELDGVWADPGGAGAAGKVGGDPVLGTHSTPLNSEKVGESSGLSIPALYNGFKSREWEAGRNTISVGLRFLTSVIFYLHD